VKLYIHDLPVRFHQGVVDAEPRLQRDFFLVEHRVHQNLRESPARTHDAQSADLFFVPFYPSCIYAAHAYRTGLALAKPSRPRRLRTDLHLLRSFGQMMSTLTARPEWRRRGGRDHVFVFGQGRGPNLGYIWRRYHRQLRGSIVLGVEARPSEGLSAFNPETDRVIPGYVPWYDVIEEVCKESRERDLLIHFRGRAWGRVRGALFEHLRSSGDVLVSAETRYQLGTEGRSLASDDVRDYYREMRRATFCLCPSGWSPWSRRFYEAILLGSIPVVIPGDFVPPFRKRLDYARFTLTFPAQEIPRLEARLRAIPQAQVRRMQAALLEVRSHFIYHEAPRPGDAGSMLLEDLEVLAERQSRGSGA